LRGPARFVPCPSMYVSHEACAMAKARCNRTAGCSEPHPPPAPLYGASSAQSRGVDFPQPRRAL
jgi:hypothetical protein